MWILMKKTVSGPTGCYPKDLRFDLPEQTIEQFDEASYEKSCAPWDDKVDQEKVRLAERRACYERAVARCELLSTELDRLQTNEQALRKKAKAAGKVFNQARVSAEAAEKNAADKKAGSKAAKKAAAFRRHAERLDALYKIAMAEATIAAVNLQLKQQELEDATTEADSIAAELGIAGPTVFARPDEGPADESAAEADDQPEGPAVPPAEQ